MIQQLGRDPEASIRTREFIDRVRSILNALLLAGEIEQIGLGNWTAITADTIIGHQVFGR